MCNEEIIKHMKEDITFRGLAERTEKSYIWRVSKYMDFYKEIEELKIPGEFDKFISALYAKD